MIARLAIRPGPRTAAGILQNVFGRVDAPLAFRLWDRSEVRLGRGEPVITVVVHSPEIFVELIRDPSPGNFAEAYVASRIDFEGDLFAAMELADVIDSLKVSLGQRLWTLASLWREVI